MTLAQQKKKVKALIDKYKKKLFLDQWDIQFVVSKDASSQNGAVGETKVDATYMWACITIYQGAFKGFNNIDEIICHEVCHCITEPLYLLGHDLIIGTLRTEKELLHQREKLTQWLTNLTKD